MRLSNQNLAQLPADVARPAYERNGETGLVHLGVGAFHRAHQAAYTDRLLAESQGEHNWMIKGISLKSPEMKHRLSPQNGLFTLRVQDGDSDALRVVGSLKQLMFAGDEPQQVKDSLAAGTTRVITMTITEKGYCRHSTSGELEVDLPDVQFDLSGPAVPRTAIGWLAQGLAARRDAGRGGVTLLSCDNLPRNGDALRRVLLAFAETLDPSLARWIDDNVTFPSSMVDRIVPAVTAEVLDSVSRRIGMRDEAAVVTEPFTQWVIEDNFMCDRPAWETAGAIMTSDIGPFETMKLRLLNGAHSALAYLGHLAGHTFVSDCMGDPALRSCTEEMMRREILPTVTPPAGYSLNEYVDRLLHRFANPRLQHACLQIAMDGSQKLPQRQLATIAERLEKGEPFNRLALAVAAWMIFVTGRDLAGTTHDIADPMSALLVRQAAPLSGKPAELVASLLDIAPIFGRLGASGEFRHVLTQQVNSLYSRGVAATLQSLETSA